MIRVEKQGIDVVMSKVQDKIKRPVTLEEIETATGVSRFTLRRMKQGLYGDSEKLKPVYEFLYKLGGLKPPKRVAVAWLVWEDAPAEAADANQSPA